MTRARKYCDRGAAAVEFALVAPVLIALILGIATFGLAYQQQAIIASAAREGARVMAITNDASAAQNAAVGAAPGVALSTGQVQVSACAGSGGLETTTVTVSHTFALLGVTIPMTGQAVMRCGG